MSSGSSSSLLGDRGWGVVAAVTAVLIWVLVLPGHPSWSFTFRRWGFSPFVAGALSALAAAALAAGAAAGWKIRWREVWPLALLWVGLLPGALSSMAPAEYGWPFFAHLVALSAGLVWLVRPIDLEEDWRWLAVVLTAISTGVAVFGLVESLVGANPLYESVWEHRHYARLAQIGRPAATQINPVPLATSLGMSLPFALLLAIRARAGRLRTAAWVCVALQVACLLRVESRGPVLALVVMWCFWCVARRRWRRLTAGLVLFAVAITVPELLTDRRHLRLGAFLGEGSGLFSKYRLDRIRMSARMLRSKPLTGDGFGAVRLGFHDRYPDPQIPKEFRGGPIVDNMYLNLFAEGGLPAGLAFLVLVWVAFVRGWRACRTRAGPLSRPATAAALASFVGALVGLAHYDLLLFTGVSGFFFLLVGLLLRASPAASSTEELGACRD